MSNALKRALRTFLQTFIGVLLASGIFTAASDTGTFDINAIARVIASGISAGIVAVLTFIQNWLEDSEKIPTVLK